MSHIRVGALLKRWQVRVAAAVTLAIGITVAAVVPGLAGTPSTPTDLPAANPVSYVPVVANDRAPVSADEALTDTMAGMKGSSVIGAKLSAPDQQDYRANAKWFDATVAVASSDPAALGPGIWQANLIQGAVAERIATTGNLADGISGSDVNGQLPDATIVKDISDGAGDVAAGQRFTSPYQTDADIQQSVEGIVEKAGFTPLEVRVFHPFDTAVSVVFQADDPTAASGSLQQLLTAIEGDTYPYEGVYLEVRIPDGTVLGEESIALRTGAGRQWSNPEYPEFNSGVLHG